MRHRSLSLLLLVLAALAWLVDLPGRPELFPPASANPWQELVDAPSQDGGETVFLDGEDFAIWFDPATMNPALVAHELREHSYRNLGRRPAWKVEGRLPHELRVSPAAYEGSGYDRGHLAPMADMDAARAEEATFTIANAIPQEPAFNRGPWQLLEREVRALVAGQSPGPRDRALVFTGPAYADDRPARFLEDGVRVPDGCFKVVALLGDDAEVDDVRVWLYWSCDGEVRQDKAVDSLAALRLVTGVDLHLK